MRRKREKRKTRGGAPRKPAYDNGRKTRTQTRQLRIRTNLISAPKKGPQLTKMKAKQQFSTARDDIFVCLCVPASMAFKSTSGEQIDMLLSLLFGFRFVEFKLDLTFSSSARVYVTPGTGIGGHWSHIYAWCSHNFTKTSTQRNVDKNFSINDASYQIVKLELNRTRRRRH